MVTKIYFLLVASQHELGKVTKECPGLVSERRIIGLIMSEYAVQNASVL